MYMYVLVQLDLAKIGFRLLENKWFLLVEFVVLYMCFCFQLLLKHYNFDVNLLYGLF